MTLAFVWKQVFFNPVISALPVLTCLQHQCSREQELPLTFLLVPFFYLFIFSSKTALDCANGVGSSEKDQESSRTKARPVSLGRQLRMSE